MSAAEPSSESSPQRKWVPATVGVCHWQTATDRFGADAKAVIRDRERAALGLHPLGHETPFLWAPEGFGEEDVNENSIHRYLPATQSYRNNLTALSQTCNLYFVAYQSHIFVYVPRSIARQRLPRHPDCRLRCEPSAVAPYIGGYVDRLVPHSINNLVAGFLGNEEILVACCDDGEVYAYYTREVAEWISLQQRSPLVHPSGPRRPKSTYAKPPTHFFRENVGMSAWGLAVHRQSRLIAVSSNRREVTVFAFALENEEQDEQIGQKYMKTECFVRMRTKNWRIVLALGRHANNIPNICFLDDDAGEAEKVSAVDIDGYVWIADIFVTRLPVICIGPSAGSLRRSQESIGAPSRGWGILALPEECFLTVDTLEELIGGEAQIINAAGQVCPQPMANIEPCVRAIPKNPCPEFAPTLDRLHNVDMLLPGPDALHAIANLLGNVGGQLNVEPEDEDMEDEEEEEEEEEEDEEDEEESEVIDAEVDEEEATTEGDDMDEGSDVSWAGDELIGNATTGTVSNVASIQAGADQATSIHTWSPSAAANVLAPAPSASGLSKLIYSEMAARGADEPGVQPDWFKMDEDMAYFPQSGCIMGMPQATLQLASFLNRSREVSETLQGRFGTISKRHQLMRLYEKDFEMRSVWSGDGLDEEKEIGIYCPNALTFGSFHDRNLRPYFRATSRLSMVMHIPELSLVVVGSPIGRVLLLTPTRLSTRLRTEVGYWSHGLRVEWILPRAGDDICHGNQRRPLHGIAIGPVQDERGVGGQGSDGASVPRRCRLMLHYRNHDVAAFEITREEQTGKLCVF